jgi:hypothetical protein
MRVFLSYSHEDRPVAQKLAIDLTRAGLDVWYDSWEIRPGDSIVEKIDHGLRVHDYLVVVLTPRSVESGWVRRELNSSLMKNVSARDIKIIPALFEPCDMPSLLADISYANFTASYTRGFDDLLHALGITTPVPAYSAKPRHITDAPAEDPDGPVRTIFATTFSDWPRCMLSPDGDLDLSIIVGSTPREHTGDGQIFATRSVTADILGTRWEFSRQYSPGSTRDLAPIGSLAAFLAAQSGKGSDAIANYDQICVPDIAVTDETLQKNIILIGAADTNLWFSLATIAFRQRFGHSLPIRYSGDEQLYFTCDEIYSELSGNVYARLEESGHMHCGYVLMAPNPWHIDKIMVLISGLRATGTQAALLSLVRIRSRRAPESENWQSLPMNNRYRPLIPAKIVRATRAIVLNNQEYISPRTIVDVPAYGRIPQRHEIIDFEFLE